MLIILVLWNTLYQIFNWKNFSCGFLYQNGPFFDKKKFFQLFFLKSLKMIFFKIWFSKMFISSNSTISQHYFVSRTPQKKALWFWSLYGKSAIFPYKRIYDSNEELLTRSSYKNNFFEKFWSCRTLSYFTIFSYLT